MPAFVRGLGRVGTRRARSAFVACAAGIAVPGSGALALATAPAVADGRSSLDRAERQLVRGINQERARHGAPRLKLVGGLIRSADRHTRDMVTSGRFAHASSNGTQTMDRIRRFYPAGRIGENLAYVPWGRGLAGAREVVAMWMDSPPHRAVLLSTGFRRVGVARRSGRIQGMSGHFFTADFASPRG
jgi:uncharacterized protein YkwD